MRAANRSLLALRALFAGLLFLVLMGAVHAAPVFPQLTGRVVDEAGILSAKTQRTLTGMLAQHERQTGNQIVVVTVKSLQGYAIDDYGYQLGRAWGIGQKGRNNGALLLVAPNERDVRVEVGYGLEGRLTDAQSKLIIENLILPEFRRGNFDAGVMAGTTTLLKVLGGDASALPSPAAEPIPGQDSSGVGLFFAIVFIMLFFWPVLLAAAVPRRIWWPSWWSWRRRIFAGRLFRWWRLIRWRRRLGALVTVMGYMSEDDRRRLHDALSAAEKRTHAHLAVVITPISERYLAYSLVYSAAGAFAAGVVLALFWPQVPLRAGIFIEADFLIGLAVLFQWAPLRLLLVPHHVKHKRCADLARREFAARILADPRHRPGLLLFVSLRERYVKILADHSVHTKVGEGAWDRIVADFIAILKADRPKIAGLVACLEACAEILESHHPPTGGDFVFERPQEAS